MTHFYPVTAMAVHAYEPQRVRTPASRSFNSARLHSFRRFVKTTISDLGYADYSEYFIGHSGSTSWRKKDSEKAEIFRKIEPYLTFLNIQQLERQGADIQTKVEELEELNHSLRQRDKVKDDAIAQLSDNLCLCLLGCRKSNGDRL